MPNLSSPAVSKVVSTSKDGNVITVKNKACLKEQVQKTVSSGTVANLGDRIQLNIEFADNTPRAGSVFPPSLPKRSFFGFTGSIRIKIEPPPWCRRHQISDLSCCVQGVHAFFVLFRDREMSREVGGGPYMLLTLAPRTSTPVSSRVRGGGSYKLHENASSQQ